MKKVILILSLILMISCSKKDDFKDDLSLRNLDLTELDFGLNQKEFIVNIDFGNQKDVRVFSNELINEFDEMIAGQKNIYYKFTLVLDRKNKLLKIVNISKNEISSTMNLKSFGDPYDDLMGSCPEGWTDEGNCSSAACVKKKIGAVLTKVEGNGDCQRVQVSRGWVSAKICSQSC